MRLLAGIIPVGIGKPLSHCGGNEFFAQQNGLYGFYDIVMNAVLSKVAGSTCFQY